MPTENNSHQTLNIIKQAQELLAQAVNLLDSDTDKKDSAAKSIKSKQEGSKNLTANSLDFSMPIRAFLKKHSPNLSGAKQLTLLIAYLAKGDESRAVALADIEKNWSAALMGVSYNRAFPTRARDNDWINASGAGTYQLRPSWREIFS